MINNIHNKFSILLLSILIAITNCTKLPLKEKPEGFVRKENSEVFAQLGHQQPIKSIAVSPDGRYVLTAGGNDKSAKLWDFHTGKEIRSFGHEGGVVFAGFSPNGSLVLTGSFDGTIKIWDMKTGESIRMFKTHKGAGVMAISPDGRYTLTGGFEKTAKLWNIKTGRSVRSFIGHDAHIVSLTFSPDGQYALTGGYNNTVMLWEVSTGREIRSLFGHTGWVCAVAFSPNGQYAVTGGYDKTAKLWEVDTGNEIRSFIGHSERITSVSFSPNGQYVLTGSDDGTVKLWEVDTGNEIRSFLGNMRFVPSSTFSADGRYILAADDNDSVRLLEIDTGTEIRSFTGDAVSPRSVTFSPDGRFAITGGHDGSIRFWEVVTGKSSYLLKGHSGIVSLSPDGQYALTRGYDKKNVRLLEVSTGREIHTFKGHTGNVLAVTYSPDGRYALTGSEDKSAKIWEVATGKVVRTLKGHKKIVVSVAISPNGRFALTGSQDGTAKLWNVNTGQEVRSLEGHYNKKQSPFGIFHSVLSVEFSTDGRYALTGSADGTAKLWRLDTGREIRSFKHKGWVFSATLSPDGQYALTGGYDKAVRLWEVSTGREIHTFEGHTTSISSVCFSPDGKFIMTGSSDGTAKLWDLKNRSELCQFVNFKDEEWIVMTPEGYYNSSRKGHEKLNIRKGIRLYGIDQFYDVFYRPDIVMAKVKGENIKDLITITIEDAIKMPPPSVKFTVASKITDKSKIKVCYQVKNTGGGIGEVRLFHNGKLIHSDGYYKDMVKASSEKIEIAAINSRAIYEDMRGVSIEDKKGFIQMSGQPKRDIFEDCREIETISGENEISATAFNSSNTVQSYMKTISIKSSVIPEEPHLYIFSIGIDRYKDSSINLRYAAKDAKEIEEKLKAQASTLYQPHNIHYELLTDREATKTNITEKINKFSQMVKPQDSFILFVAGHGILLQNQYYMITHEYNGTANSDCMISSNEIVDMSKEIKSLSQLLIFDTCHAGGVDYIISGLYDSRMSVLAKKMGLHIYASASDKQAAIDGYKGNGLFSYSLLEGLNNNQSADANYDKQVGMVELGSFSKRMTTELSEEIGHSQTPLIINFGKDNSLYELK